MLGVRLRHSTAAGPRSKGAQAPPRASRSDVVVAADGKIVVRDDEADSAARGKRRTAPGVAEAMDLDGLIEDGERTYAFRGDKPAAKKAKRNVQWDAGHGGDFDDDDDDDDDGGGGGDNDDGGGHSDTASVGTRDSRGTRGTRGTRGSRGTRGTRGSARSARIETGDRFRARRAGGDVKRAGDVDPFAYVPLSAAATTKRKHAKSFGKDRNVVAAAMRGSAAGKRQHQDRRGKGRGRR